jgi:23S rRNA (uridine2552-2'-O)-methyltransferase
MAYKPGDHYARKARREHFAARSVYKLEELDRKYRIFKPGDSVLDLGASPGSWSQYASAKVKEHGRITGVDLKPVTVSLPNAEFIQADIRMEPEGGTAPWQLRRYQVVMSDMAPSTTGHKLVDQAASLELCERALDTAIACLRPNGHFICKIFESADMPGFRDEVKKHFGETHLYRPKSTQKGSKEIFLAGLRFRGA